jgi:hypothetical protein
MSSSSSSEMKNRLTMAFQGIMKKVMSILQAEEVVAAAVSSSVRGLKRRR